MNKRKNVFDYIGLLDEKRETELRNKMKEIDDRGIEYDRTYFLQVDNYELHNTKFPSDRVGIEPEIYKGYLQQELMAYAEDLYTDQATERLEKEEKEMEAKDRQLEETDVEKLSQIQMQQDIPAEKTGTPQEKFREQRKDVERDARQDDQRDAKQFDEQSKKDLVEQKTKTLDEIFNEEMGEMDKEAEYENPASAKEDFAKNRDDMTRDDYDSFEDYDDR